MAECRGDWVQRGPDAVEQLLDAVREQPLAYEHGQEEDWNPAVGSSQVAHNSDHEGQDDDEPRRAELRDEGQPAVGLGPRMIGAPLGDAGIEIDQPGVRVHEIRERADHEASDRDDAEGDRQSESSGNPRIEPARDGSAEPAVVPELAAQCLRGSKAGRR